MSRPPVVINATDERLREAVQSLSKATEKQLI